MVYTGNQAILFGGTDGNEIFHNPWGWRGTLWPQHQNMGPPNRGLNSMAYDRDRNVVVIFDGGDINRDFKDAWKHRNKRVYLNYPAPVWSLG